MIASHKCKAVEDLIEAGIIPPNTTKFTLTLAVGQVCRITVERLATEEELQKIADVVIQHREKFNDIDTDITDHTTRL